MLCRSPKHLRMDYDLHLEANKDRFNRRWIRCGRPTSRIGREVVIPVVVSMSSQGQERFVTKRGDFTGVSGVGSVSEIA